MFDDFMKFSEIFKKGNEGEIAQSLKFIAVEMARYHIISVVKNFIDYPLQDMLDKVVAGFDDKFAVSADKCFDEEELEILEALQFITRKCKQIPAVLQACISDKSFSQNDTLPSSIYINFIKSQAFLVDWEYAANSFWPNDLAILASHLTKEQQSVLAQE